jgi:methionyl-tRNA formyltransferase
VRIVELQMEGRTRMSAGEFLRGHKLAQGMRLM